MEHQNENREREFHAAVGPANYPPEFNRLAQSNTVDETDIDTLAMRLEKSRESLGVITGSLRDKIDALIGPVPETIAGDGGEKTPCHGKLPELLASAGSISRQIDELGKQVSRLDQIV